ncbi:MAG: tRNA-(ms[2]io[6]A)-hydroxylase [Saprospiraceae bacterium]|nr:tRNA-(ms[2]io[6]A)-hydroxylase [Saprospiraceae bacterium]MBK9688010.1 tRNA-(ms[2]io[6]A)-hydroxylase [Saprospiraceae bacterium]MBL0083278.1 tRNA-(ms[2]io[6]A)-hydroxylase [Saprospiraceae bacterium]
MIDKTKLGLHLPTDPRWVNLAEMSLEYILTDHAFCEQKAATACISLIQQYPDKKELVKALMPVVTEEWGHFRMVLREMEKRDMTLGFQRKDEYVNALQKFRKHGNRDVNLIESLLICALIEARSCERFRLLSLHISEESLKQFYYDLMVSEAGHYKMFLELAIHYGGEDTVRKRWQEYLVFEAGVMKELTADGTRIH